MTNEPNNSINPNNDVLAMRIGKTTFLVSVKPSETADKPIESAFRNLCIHETLNGFSDNGAEKDDNLEKLQKTS